MSSLKLKTPSGGSVSFNATNTASDVTLTVPASNANVLTDSAPLPAIDGSALTNLPAPAALTTASGSAPSYSARAWINMDGTGTISIRGSGNVSSIVDNGTGDYTVNFSTNMSGTNYNVVGSSNHNTTYANSRMFFQSISTLRLTSSVRVRALGDGGSALDVDTVDFCIFE